MLDFGFDKLALIGAVSLIVIGPEKLPKVARTLGHLMGKAQRYISEVRAEVNRSIELDEIRKMKTQFEDAARDVERSVQTEVKAATSELDAEWSSLNNDGVRRSAPGDWSALATPVPTYKNPRKNWRLKRGVTPVWYKRQAGIRTKAQSGAARVARFRPPGLKTPR